MESITVHDFSDDDPLDVSTLDAGDLVEVETLNRSTITGVLHAGDADDLYLVPVPGAAPLWVREASGEPGVKLRGVKLIKKGAGE